MPLSFLFRGNLVSNQSCQNGKIQMPERSFLLEWPFIRHFFPQTTAWQFSPTCPGTLYHSQCFQHENIERGTAARNFSYGRRVSLPQIVTLSQFIYPDRCKVIRSLNKILAAPNIRLVLSNVTATCTVDRTSCFGLYVATVCACNFYRSQLLHKNLCTVDCDMIPCLAACLLDFDCG
jgi:hypothetical protein